MTAIFIRTRNPKDRTETGFVPDSFFERFGADTAVVEKDYRGECHVTTFTDLGGAKRDRQAKRLEWKREGCGTTEIRPVYVWVFWCPGLGGFAYRGWWTYLVGRGIECGKYLSHNERMIRRIMELFPVEAPGLFGPSLTHYEWMPRFAKMYQRGKHCGKPQGKAPVWAEVRNGNVQEIIKKAKWPRPD
jgi:hypothetical protein